MTAVEESTVYLDPDQAPRAVDAPTDEVEPRDPTGSSNGLVLVLGMHRSGTSALAGALVAAGAWAGEAEELMAADEHNQRGYFERAATAAALDDVLGELGGTWSIPPIENLRRAVLKRYEPFLRRLISEASAGAPGGAPSLVKDPRLCLFGAELAEILDERSKVLLTVRHPLEVAQSLLTRDGIPIPVGLALWESYNVAVCSGFAGLPVHVVSYDQLLKGGDVLAAVLTHTLGFDGEIPVRSYEAALRHLSRDLRRERVEAGNEDEWMTLPVARLWRELNERADELRPMPMANASLSRSSREQLLLEAGRRRPASMASPSRDGSGADDAPLEQLRLAHSEIRLLTDELAKQRGDLIVAAADREALARELTEVREGLAASAVEKAASETRRRQIAEHLTQSEAERDRLTTETAAAQRRTARIEAKARRAERMLAEAVSERDAVADALTALQSGAADLAEDAAMHHEEWQRLRAEVDRLTGDLVARVVELAAVSEQRDDQASRLRQATNELAKARAELAQARSRQEEVLAAAVRQREDWSTQIAVVTSDRDQLAGRLTILEEQHAELHHRLLVEIDQARAFVESIRSVVGDFHTDVILEWLDEAELVNWARVTCQERDRLSAANATLLQELNAVNRHREQLVSEIIAISGSESWKVGRLLTWPARLVLRRGTHGTDSGDDKMAAGDISLGDDAA